MFFTLRGDIFMSKKRILSSIFAVLLCTSLLSGCTAAKEKKAEAVTVKVLTQSLPTLQQTELLDFIDQYEKQHSGIKIELEDGGNNYFSNIMGKIQTKSEPDVFMMDNSSVSSLAGSGTLSTLDEYMDEKDISDFNTNLLNQFKVNGKLYGIPLAGDTLALYYNKDMFDAAGLKPPSNWTELENAAIALTKGDTVGLCLEYDPFNYIPFMLQAGGKLSDGTKATFNSEECVKGLSFFNSLFTKKIAATSQSLSADNVVKAITNKSAAMIIGFSSFAQYIDNPNNSKINWAVVPLPKGDTNGNFFQASGVVVSSRTKHKKEAVEVAKFLSDKNAQGLITEGSVAIPSRKSAQQEYVKTHSKMEPFIAMLNTAVSLNYGENTGRVFNALTEATNKLRSKEMQDVKQALDYGVKFYNESKQ